MHCLQLAQRRKIRLSRHFSPNAMRLAADRGVARQKTQTCSQSLSVFILVCAHFVIVQPSFRVTVRVCTVVNSLF